MGCAASGPQDAYAFRHAMQHGDRLPDADTMAKARALVGDKPIPACGSNPGALARIAALQSHIAAIVPAQPNERIVYHCQKGRLAPVDPAQ